MSRRRNPGDPRRATPPADPSPPPGANRPERPRGGSSGPSFLPQLGIVIGVFVVATLLAELFGADSLGIAIGVGQIAFAIALMAVLLRGS